MDIVTFKKLLTSTDKAHNAFMSKAAEGTNYYHNNSGIRRTGTAAIDEVNNYLKKLGKNPLKTADNRIPTNWHKILTDQKVGYLFTYPPQFDAKTEDAGKALSEVLGGKFTKVIKQLGIHATNCGVGWLAYWYSVNENDDDKFHYWYIDPSQIRVVFDSASAEPIIKQLIRQWDEVISDDKTVTHYELWDKDQVMYFRSENGAEPSVDTEKGESGIIKHTYGRIPFIPFRNNADSTGDLSMYKEIVDSIDKLVSGFANDIDDLQEIIWVIKNYAGEFSEEDYDKDGNIVTRDIDLLQKLKARKLINIDGDGGIDTITGEIPYEARKEFLDILKSQLYISAMAVDPFPSAVGQASGVYIDFLYSLLELKAGLMETEFRASLDELAEAVFRYKNIEPAPIEQIWTRNKPRNDTEVAQIIASTPEDVLSSESKTKAHPLTENWQEERKRIDEEKAAQAKRYEDLIPPTGGDGE